jgi:osmotically-inducible protein OsmY
MRSGRGGEFGGAWDQNEGRWASGGDLDREDYTSNDEEYGGQPRGGYGSRGQGGWSQGGYTNRGQSSQFGGGQWGGGQFRGEGSRNFGNQGGYGNQRYGGSQGFSGGHYGGFANEGYPGQGNYGGNRGFSNQGYSGQRFNQGSSAQGRGFSGQGSWNQQGGWDQGTRNQSDQGYGQNYGQAFGHGYAARYEGRGFAGRGPKGYQRSDDRIKEQVSDRLMDDDDIDASEITVEVRGAEVTLTGTVNSREEKRLAEEAAEQAPGVREVQNHLRVQESSSFAQSNPPARTSSTPGQKTSSKERE